MRNGILFFFIFLSLGLTSQTDIQIQIPENYELSNILLALTDYGKADESEVQKNSRYYKEVIRFFDSVKTHPLLKKINYSREQWEDYLSFRTDAIAFSFDPASNQLKRKSEFKANTGHDPFDKNIALINDFIKQSHFRSFYKVHQLYYDSIVSSYRSYYMLNEMTAFLKKECAITPVVQKKEEYKIILSPLVGRMNCHRNISKTTVADFPSLTLVLIDQPSANKPDKTEQAVAIHTLFTEADHGYIDPISKKFEKELNAKMEYTKWDKGSGYAGIPVFNEYMTWALYDLFIKKYFPAVADSVCTQWHYQNGERGFFASSAFAKKLAGLYKTKTALQTLTDLYPGMIQWCIQFQKDISLPMLFSPIEPQLILDVSNVSLELIFSEPMNEKEILDVNIISLTDKKYSTIPFRLTKEKNNIRWAEDGRKLNFTISLHPAEQSTLQMNWWGCTVPLESKKGVMLKVFSKVVLNHPEKQ